MLVAFRSPRPSRKADLFVSVLTSRTAGYATRTSGGVGGALSDGRPYSYGRLTGQKQHSSRVLPGQLLKRHSLFQPSP